MLLSIWASTESYNSDLRKKIFTFESIYLVVCPPQCRYNTTSLWTTSATKPAWVRREHVPTMFTGAAVNSSIKTTHTLPLTSRWRSNGSKFQDNRPQSKTHLWKKQCEPPQTNQTASAQDSPTDRCSRKGKIKTYAKIDTDIASI